MKKDGKKGRNGSYKTVADLGGNAFKKPVASMPAGEGKRPGGEIGLPEDLRVIHAEEHNPHDG